MKRMQRTKEMLSSLLCHSTKMNHQSFVGDNFSHSQVSFGWWTCVQCVIWSHTYAHNEPQKEGIWKTNSWMSTLDGHKSTCIIVCECEIEHYSSLLQVLCDFTFFLLSPSLCYTFHICFDFDWPLFLIKHTNMQANTHEKYIRKRWNDIQTIHWIFYWLSTHTRNAHDKQQTKQKSLKINDWKSMWCAFIWRYFFSYFFFVSSVLHVGFIVFRSLRRLRPLLLPHTRTQTHAIDACVHLPIWGFVSTELRLNKHQFAFDVKSAREREEKITFQMSCFTDDKAIERKYSNVLRNCSSNSQRSPCMQVWASARRASISRPNKIMNVCIYNWSGTPLKIVST